MSDSHRDTKTSTMKLEDLFSEWEDFDGAAFKLGVLFGFWEDNWFTWQQKKSIFWTRNPLGEMLHNMLLMLTAAQILEFNGTGEDEQFRYNKNFKEKSLIQMNIDFNWPEIIKAGWPSNWAPDILETIQLPADESTAKQAKENFLAKEEEKFKSQGVLIDSVNVIDDRGGFKLEIQFHLQKKLSEKTLEILFPNFESVKIDWVVNNQGVRETTRELPGF